MKRGETLLMSVFDSNMVRNMLRTDVLRTLRESDALARIVLLVREDKVAEYTREFADDKVLVRAYPPNQPSRAELVAWFAARQIIHTKNVRAKIDELLDRAPGSPLVRFAKYAAALAIYYGSMIPIIDKLIRAAIIATYDGRAFERLMREFHPDIVFLPTIFGNNDVRLLKYCVTHGVPTVGMIKSWDNLLGKDSLLIWPDRLVVHNEIVAGYAHAMHAYPLHRIFISGIPQYDVFVREGFLPDRDAFFKHMGLDPEKRLILYSAMGGWISLHERSIVEMLADIVNNSGRLAYSSQLLVRLHPAYKSDDQHLYNIPGIKVVRPGVPSSEWGAPRFDFEFREEDTRELAATLRWSDVAINSGSTMTIDAACFDTPIINIAFDGREHEPKPERSARRLLEKEHYLPIVQSGGVRIVGDEGDLVEELNAYLSDRGRDAEGRRRVVREQCYRMDGKSGARIASYILGMMKELSR